MVTKGDTYLNKLFPVNICLFKVDYINTRKKCEICSKLITTHHNNVVVVYLLLTLNIFHTFFNVSVADFAQVKFGSVITITNYISLQVYYKVYLKSMGRFQ